MNHKVTVKCTHRKGGTGEVHGWVDSKSAESMVVSWLSLGTPWLALGGPLQSSDWTHKRVEKTVLSPCVASISGGSLGERLPADCCEDLAPVSLSTPGGVWLQQHSSLLSFTTCWWYRSLQLSILFECLDLSSIQRRVDLVLEQMLGSVILQPILPV